MRFVALVSGGKDSCYNIAHCLNAGHELVAMANLRPAEGRPEEIDSYMYQTVGHNSVAQLAKCANVPLFRATISENEETVVAELAGFLNKIKLETGIEGVSSGAIKSSYQQQRVDKACAIAGLQPLSYMWQRDQTLLLDEIINSGIDARIVKVAGMGLNDTHLKHSLKELRDEILSLPIHPCGEGGEYETFVLDAPFFKQKLEFSETEIVQHASDDVFYLLFDVNIVPKLEIIPSELTVPSLLDDKTTKLLQPVDPIAVSNIQTGNCVPESYKLQQLASPLKSKTFSGSLDQEVFGLMHEFLKTVSVESCVHIYVAIKSMSRFAELNRLYANIFSGLEFDLPPSRTCLECDISDDLELTVVYTSELDPSARGIHVQGLSYWAPASIGPYSQCRLALGISYIAGQIGLIPQSLTLPSDFETQALLAFQNAVRVLNMIHEERTNWVTRLAVVYITDSKYLPIVQQIWTNFAKANTKTQGLPLITAVVPRMPRYALVEWSLQGCDLRYFQYYVPETDEEDLFYSESPQIIDADYEKATYTHRAGFQLLKVAQSLPEPILVIGTALNEKSGHFVPSTHVYFNTKKVERICIS